MLQLTFLPFHSSTSSSRRVSLLAGSARTGSTLPSRARPTRRMASSASRSLPTLRGTWSKETSMVIKQFIIGYLDSCINVQISSQFSRRPSLLGLDSERYRRFHWMHCSALVSLGLYRCMSSEYQVQLESEVKKKSHGSERLGGESERRGVGHSRL